MCKDQKLKTLIKRSEQLDEFRWLSAVGLPTAEDVTPAVMEPLSTESVRTIYLRRSKLNKIRGEPINGFEYLLKKLSTTTVDKVCIHALFKSGNKYLVFTDPAISELLGILGPLRTEMEF